MKDEEKLYKKFKLGLAVRKVMNVPGRTSIKEGQAASSKKATISFRELESLSGIRHATIVQIVNGRKNPSWSTIDAILEGLNLTLKDFAIIYDGITANEILEYQKDIKSKEKKP